ncbi:MAG: hypothetical protein JRJ84_03400 [Deltaproteobacteria bacterium]|nr:hypothetical protein [Deltaproteobacteria bacterium]
MRAAVASVAAAAAVFSREAVRNARRWQTYALRVVFSVVVFGMVIAIWADVAGPRMDAGQAGEVGRSLFMVYAYVQMGLGMVLAPLLVGLGISEEKEERTLELLAITHLGPRQILLGKVVSRLLVLITIVLGATPAMALTLSFGGVSAWEFVNVVVNTLLIIVVLGCIGGMVALFTRGGVAPMAATAVYAVPAFAVLPVFYVVSIRSPEEALTHLSPPFAMIADSPVGLLPVLAFLPVLWLLLRWSGPLFAMAALEHGDDGDTGRLSLEFWRFETYRRRLGYAGLGVVLLLPVCLGAAYAGAYSHPRIVPYEVAQVLMWLFMALVLFTGTGLYLLWLLRGVEVVRRWSRFRRMYLLAAPALARSASRPQRSPWFDRPVPQMLRGWVWPNPVAWRELVTRAHGVSGVVARWGFPLWLVGVFFLVMLSGDDDTVLLYVVTGTLIAIVFTISTATESMASERSAGTLPLLASTTLRSHSIVLGKLFVVAVYALPYLAVGWTSLFGMLLVEDFDRHDYTLHAEYAELLCGHFTWFPGLGATALLTVVWLLAVWAVFALGSMITGLLVRPARLAWVLNLAAAVGFFVVPVVIEEEVRGSFGDNVLELWLPVVGKHLQYLGCGASPHLVVSTCLFSALALGLFVLLSVRLRRWVLPGRS